MTLDPQRKKINQVNDISRSEQMGIVVLYVLASY